MQKLTIIYTISLLIVGGVWLLLADIAGSFNLVSREMWIQPLLSALITSLCVGFLLKNAIARYTGWRWYLLPILSLFLGTFIFGILLPFSIAITVWITGNGSVDLSSFFAYPVLFIMYSFTWFIPFFYPAALATNSVLRRILRLKEKTDK